MKQIGLYIIILFTVACSSDPEVQTVDQNQIKEPLIKANKSAAEIENEQINSYVKRRGMDVIESGTGLRYLVYEKGNGLPVREGEVVEIDFTISLLNGKECYSTKENEPQEVLVGKDDVESGLHEGLTYMHVGDKAKLIIPSHLAHGLVGDFEKIPPRSTIIYDIHILAIKYN